ncbi:hypothetical protein BH18ACI1_BH18ACI1_06000 [soil metagenome]|jgi:hypothetical protein|nr:hypothetical protein [Acidobacteriota bacterium]
MQAILNINPNDIDDGLLNIIKELLSKDVEIVIKKQSFELEEFDANIALDEVMREFGKVGYSDEFLSDLKAGFETSKIYARSNENKDSEG